MSPHAPERRPAFRWARAVLVGASRLVPFHRRGSWLAEWTGELCALQSRGRGGGTLIRFAMGGVAHALFERRVEEGTMLDGIVQDLRQALRRLGRSRGFTAVAVLVIGFGVGANTALFSAAQATLLGRPDYPEPDRIVLVDLLLQSRADVPADTMPWSYPKFELARGALRSLDDVAGFTQPSTLTLTSSGAPERVRVEFVTPSYFDLLGASPAVGRLLTPDEEAPAPVSVALLSHAFWVTRFGADPGVIGRTLTLEDVSVEIVGVLEPRFGGLTGSADLWLPVATITAIRGPRRLQLAWTHWLRGVARLGEGVSLEQARADARTVGVALTETFPDPDGGGAHGVALVPLLEARVNPVTRTAVAAVAVGAILFLLIACGNLAGLLLARGAQRRADVAVRAALGAGRRRLVREHLLESLLLALGGGVGGVGVALGAEGWVASSVRYALGTSGSRGLRFVDPDALQVDTTALVVGLGLALATGLVFGLLPAWSAATTHPAGDLRGHGGAALGRSRARAGDYGRVVLVTVQFALTLVLLAGAGLMGSSLARLDAVRAGFSNTSVFTVAYDRGPGPSADENRILVAALLERVRAMPGVLGAAVATCPPLAGRCEVLGLRQVDDQDPVDYSEMTGVLGYTATAGYFETLGVPVLEGRTFGSDDVAGGEPVVVINETAARELFGGVSALGHRISVTHELTQDRLARVIGVVGDVRYAGLDEPAMAAVYLSERQAPMPYGTLFVHTEGDPYAVLGPLRSVTAELDPKLPLFGANTMADRHSAATARTRIILGLLVAFSLSGLALSALGLYGLVSQTVTRRTREIGLRVALGARRPEVVRMIVAGPALLALVSAVFGTIAAVVVTGRMHALLFGTAARDPRVLLGAATVLVVVGVCAAWFPAMRASAIAPLAALRAE